MAYVYLYKSIFQQNVLLDNAQHHLSLQYNNRSRLFDFESHKKMYKNLLLGCQLKPWRKLEPMIGVEPTAY